MNREGELQKDIVLGEGDMYHPGGISYDGTDVWVPVAQYRPDSSAIIYKVNAQSLKATEQFRVQDHIGGIVRDETNGAPRGQQLGLAPLLRLEAGRQHHQRLGQPEPLRRLPGLPVRRLGQDALRWRHQPAADPAAGGAGATYELGGMALIDLHTHAILHEVPFQKWSTAGHVMTRNPLKLAADGKQMTMWAAPDNGDEGNGTELYTFRADVP